MSLAEGDSSPLEDRGNLFCSFFLLILIDFHSVLYEYVTIL